MNKFLKFSIQTKHKGSFYSVSAADVDRDGNLDLYVSVYNNGKEVLQNHIVEANNGGFNLLFMNKGNFKFLEEGKNRGVSQPDWTFTSMFVDIDNDTDQDLYLANDWGDNRLYINNVKGYFKDISKKAKIEDTGGGMGIAVTDINKDGYFDFYISNMYSNAGSRIIPHSKLQKNIVKNKLIKTVSGNSLFINKLHNKKTFEYVSKKMKVNKAGWAWGNIAIDYDLDGDEDLYVVNGYRSAEIKKDL